VSVEFGQTREKMRPTKAREIALVLLSSAEAAEQDAAINAFVRNDPQATTEDGARMIAMIREFRQRFEGLEA